MQQGTLKEQGIDKGESWEATMTAGTVKNSFQRININIFPRSFKLVLTEFLVKTTFSISKEYD